MCKCTPGIKTPFCGQGDCQWPEQKPIIDLVTDAVRKDLLDRSTLGIKKYGTTLDRNNGDLRYWLNHAYEEALDHAQYLKRAIMELDKTNGTS